MKYRFPTSWMCPQFSFTHADRPCNHFRINVQPPPILASHIISSSHLNQQELAYSFKLNLILSYVT